MKKRFSFLLLIALLLAGCGAQGDNHVKQNLQETEIPAQNATEEIVDVEPIEENVDMDPVSYVFNSIEELHTAISTQKAEESNHEHADSAINLSTLDSIYYPALNLDGYRLFQIEILQRRIIYYYMPTDSDDDMFNYENGITITFNRTDCVQGTSDTTDPKVALTEQAGVPLTNEGLLYEKDKNTVTLFIDDTWMGIHVPDSLNNYDLLVNTFGLDTKEHVVTKIDMMDFD